MKKRINRQSYIKAKKRTKRETKKIDHDKVKFSHKLSPCFSGVTKKLGIGNE